MPARQLRGYGRALIVALGVLVAISSLSPPAEALRPKRLLLRKINTFRAAHGVPRLRADRRLMTLAQRHSTTMARRQQLSRPTLTTLRSTNGGKYLGFVTVRARPRRIFRVFVRRHRPKLLNPAWRKIGIGLRRDGRGRQWATILMYAPSSRVVSPASWPPPNIPRTIASDCSRDVTQQLNDWIASVPDGSTLSFGHRACYRTEREIVVHHRTGLTFEGNGAVFKRFQLSPPELRWPKANAHWRFLGGSDITLRNMHVKGTNTVADQRAGFGSYKVEFEFEHAFSFHAVEDLVIERSSADAIWGDGLYFAGKDGWAVGPCRNVRVSGFVVDRNGRQGVALSNVDGVLLENVKILHSRRAGFDLEPPPGSVQNVEIRHSYTNTIGLAFASAGRNDVSNIFIHHNRIDGPSAPWIYVKESMGERRRNWVVQDNVVLNALGSPAAMMLFGNVDNVDVRRNTSHAKTTQSRKAVEFRGAGGTLVVANNDFTGACAPYVKDDLTGPVLAHGNIVSPDGSCP